MDEPASMSLIDGAYPEREEAAGGCPSTHRRGRCARRKRHPPAILTRGRLPETGSGVQGLSALQPLLAMRPGVASDIVCSPTDQVEDMDKAGFLKQTSLFAGFGDKEIESVLGTAKERTFASGEAIIRDGHEGGRGFYLLLDGAAEVTKGDVHLARFGPGDYFGEMALLLDETPRTANVTATVDTTCLVITQWDLKALIKNHPEIGVKMMAELARRLRDTDAALTD